MNSTLLKEKDNLEPNNNLTVVSRANVNHKGTLKRAFSKNNFDESEILRYLNKELGDKVMNFVSRYVDVDNDFVRSMYLVSAFNVATLPYKSYEGIVNVCKINFNQNINSTLEVINQKLEKNGLYIGCADTYSTRKHRHKSKYGIFYYIFHPLDFLVHRVFSKLKWSRKLYLKLTKGNKRVMSLTETFGRLVRAGFDIVDYSEVDNTLWYVAKKVGEPDKRPVPDYGLMYKKRCIGKGGKNIEIFKVRSMHPYAEYLQSYMIRTNGYSEKGDGKINNDFRVTNWGKIIRKLYLDEVPQIISVLKGDMAIVGVRPVTKARLEEFPPQLVKARQAHKPGCLPPYVALRMGDELGNIQAEWIYLKDREKYGAWTDVKFFVKSIYNIVSGKMWSA